MASGNRAFYIPIAPKPPATLAQYPLATSSIASTGLTSSFVASALDLSNLPILLTQTQSTPTVQNSSDMVAQTTLLPSTSVSAGLPVAVQDPSSASSIVTLNETTSSLHSSGNIVPQSQSPLSAVVTQNRSTPAVHSSTSILPQTQSVVSALMQTTSTPTIYSSGKILQPNQSPLVTTVSQTSSTPAVNSPGKVLAQNQSALAAAVPQTLSAPAVNSPGKILPQNQSSLVAAVSQTLSTPVIYSRGKILPQNQQSLVAAVSQTSLTPTINSSGNMRPQSQSLLIAAVSQTPLTPAVNSTGYTVAQNQPSLSATISQTPSAPSILRSGNTLGQIQLPSLAVVSQSSPSPADPSFDDMVPQRPLQTPPPIIVSHNASSQPVQSSLNMPPQNQLPMLSISQSDFCRPFHSSGMSTNNESSSTIVSHTAPSQVPQSAPQRFVSTYGISGNTSMPLYQNSTYMVRQNQSQSFVSGSTAHHQRRFSSAPGVPGISLEQSLFGTLSTRASFDPARLTAGGNNLTTNEVINEPHESFFSLSTSDRSAESPLNVLANASDIVQRGQTTNSNASSLHVQV